MEIPQPITTRPLPCDLAREHCEQIFNDYRESSFSYVDLMIMAYRKGLAIGSAEAFDAVRGLLPSRKADERAPADIYDNPRPRMVSNANGYEGGCEP